MDVRQFRQVYELATVEKLQIEFEPITNLEELGQDS